MTDGRFSRSAGFVRSVARARSFGRSACIFANKGAAAPLCVRCPPGRPAPPPTRNRPRPRPSVSSTGVQFWWRRRRRRPQWERETADFRGGEETLQIPRVQCSRKHRYIQFSGLVYRFWKQARERGEETGCLQENWANFWLRFAATE